MGVNIKQVFQKKRKYININISLTFGCEKITHTSEILQKQPIHLQMVYKVIHIFLIEIHQSTKKWYISNIFAY